MEPKITEQLEKILQSSHPEDLDVFLKAHPDCMFREEKAFSVYMRNLIRQNHLTQQQIFIRADFSEHYGYKLLSQEKHTAQRDHIIRLCYAANLTLEQTQRALTLYGMARLYPRIPRDAILIIAINRNEGDLSCVNELLKAHGELPLKGCSD